MKSKLLLLGGVSCVGKTSLCKQISDMHGWQHLRIHPYVLNLARKEGISDLNEHWNSLVYKIVPELVEDIQNYSGCCIDIHFAVQPKYDTSYALGLDVEEDINEPYEKGLCDEFFQNAKLNELEVSSILLESEASEILCRREKLTQIRKPRSVNIESIKRETYYENLYFKLASDIMKKYVGGKSYILNNKEGYFEDTTKKSLEFLIK